MPWFSVRVLLRCEVKGRVDKVPLFEDRIMLVRARNHSTAQMKAERLVRKREKPYQNVYGQSVIWRFHQTYESVELFDRTIVDGTEVYWRFIRARDPEKRLLREGTMNAAR